MDLNSLESHEISPTNTASSGPLLMARVEEKVRLPTAETTIRLYLVPFTLSLSLQPT